MSLLSNLSSNSSDRGGCRQTSLTTTFSYHEGHYDMFEILRPNRTYYFDNIVTPSACIKKLSKTFLFYRELRKRKKRKSETQLDESSSFSLELRDLREPENCFCFSRGINAIKLKIQ